LNRYKNDSIFGKKFKGNRSDKRDISAKVCVNILKYGKITHWFKVTVQHTEERQ